MTPEEKLEIKQLFKESIKESLRQAVLEIFMSPGLTQVDAAKYLNVSTKTIQRRIASGIIKTDKTGRIPKEQLIKTT